MTKKIKQPIEDINSSLKLSCDEHAHTRSTPHYELRKEWEGQTRIAKVCEEHREVVSTTVEVDSPWYVKISWLESRIESVVGN